jgi:hypothetical protein
LARRSFFVSNGAHAGFELQAAAEREARMSGHGRPRQAARPPAETGQGCPGASRSNPAFGTMKIPKGNPDSTGFPFFVCTS